MGPLTEFFKKPVATLIAAWIVGTVISFMVVAVRGVPAPHVQDEFGYLLTADTFASGKITNPTHPKWQHFESFHIIHQPSYTAKYPPLQSVTLAIGQTLGHPIIGACLATGISIAALFWMLSGWLPQRMHWLAWLVAVTHPSLHLFWGHSYWGGAVALTGASLLLGAFSRVNDRLSVKQAIIASVGILLLANSRPFEGAVLTLMVAIGLVVRIAIKRREAPFGWTMVLGKLVAPAAIVLTLGATAMLTYNVQVTGDPLTMPYQVHESTYGWNPVFLWQVAGEKPEYRHPDMERFFVKDKETTDQAYTTLSKTLTKKGTVIVQLLAFFCGPMILVGAVGMLLKWDRQNLVAAVLLLPVLTACIISKWANFHYAAPAAPLLMLVMLSGVWAVWQRLENYPSVRRLGTYGLVAFHCIWMLTVVGNTQKIHNSNWGFARQSIESQLLEDDGDDLVFVRYDDDHNIHHEWIYNAADIDAAPVVWAREIDSQRQHELIQYFSDRKVWLLEADASPPRLTPFSVSAGLQVTKVSSRQVATLQGNEPEFPIGQSTDNANLINHADREPPTPSLAEQTDEIN